MNRAFKHPAQGGFTLVEVSLAILVVGLGLLSLFSLFPSGLRSGEEAAADTRAGLFASVVLDGMRANAAAIKSWTDWNDGSPSDVSSAIHAKLCSSLLSSGAIVADGNLQPKLEFPSGSGQYVRYLLRLGRATTRSCSAYLRVYGRTGDNYSEFYTEFLFGGR